MPKDCNDTQYNETGRILETPLDKNQFFLHPCVHMNAKIERLQNEASTTSPTTFEILIQYRTKHDIYKEIENHRAFTFETLFGQVGGFVGTY